ncbi:MAG TPA: 16S rRNA (uracil(1498)-N(3))-methyltransferase, partial [Flavobacterium sp.]|nr:16S rRNA (uracil(1498)-N(3))-methyltransferase [Flavobacterium sp.]
MQLFYNPNISDEAATFYFDKEESKHIVKVLRKKESDNLFVTNGSGMIFKTEIVLASDSKCQAKIISSKRSDPLPYYLHMAVAPTKMNERYEWFLEKATEIGVSEITPLICEHSERKIIKAERFDRIIQSAMKQSMQSYLPILNEPASFKDFIKQENKGLLLIAHCEETSKKSLKDVAGKNSDATILIGPEGDFSMDEIQMA